MDYVPEGNLFDPVAGDKSIELLKTFFSSIFDQGHLLMVASPTAWDSALEAFNNGAMTIAFCFIAYTLGFATMQTAHDGEMLGKKWSSMWIPVRYAIGTGLMVPLQTFCVAQYIVAWAVIQGVGLADNLWNSFLQVTINEDLYAPKLVSPKVEKLVGQLLVNEACIQSAKNDRGNPISSAEYTPPALDNTRQGMVGKWGAGPNQGDTLCGSIVFDDAGLLSQTLVAPSGSALSAGGDAKNPMRASALVQDFHNMNITPEVVIAAHAQGVEAARAAVSPLAAKIAETMTSDSPVALDYAQAAVIADGVNAYNTAVYAALRSATASSSATLSEQMKKDGWLLAGSWFMRASAMQDLLQRAVDSTPNVLRPDPATLKQMGAQDALNVLIITDNFLANRAMVTPFDAVRSQTSGAEDALQQIQVLGQLTSRFRDDVKELGDDMTSGTRSPFMSLKDFGDRLMAHLQEMMHQTDSKASKQQTGKQKNDNFLVAQMQSTAMSIMWFIGSIFSVYLPMMPFIIFSMAAVGWLLVVCEAIVAAPLWVAMKFAPGGDDMMGASKNAYGMVFGVAIRPALMTLGLCAALVVLDPLLYWFNDLFFISVKNSMTSGMNQLFILIAICGVYLGLLQQLITRTFQMITDFPDKIPNWMGLNAGAGIGQFGQQAMQKAQSDVNQNMSSALSFQNSINQQTAMGQTSASMASANNWMEKKENWDNASGGADSGNVQFDKNGNLQRQSPERVSEDQKRFAMGDEQYKNMAAGKDGENNQAAAAANGNSGNGKDADDAADKSKISNLQSKVDKLESEMNEAEQKASVLEREAADYAKKSLGGASDEERQANAQMYTTKLQESTAAAEQAQELREEYTQAAHELAQAQQEQDLHSRQGVQLGQEHQQHGQQS